MGANIWFWIIYVLSLFFGGWSIWGESNYRPYGPAFVLYVLIGIIGITIYGSPIK